MRNFEKVKNIESVKLSERSTKNSAGYDFTNPVRVDKRSDTND